MFSPEIISSTIAIAALLLGAYFVIRKEYREDGQTALQRLVRIEAELASQRAEIANQKVRQQGFQAEIEGVADHGNRERVAMVENAAREHNAIKEMIKDVPSMRDLLNRMDERFLSTKEEMKNLSGKMDKILDVLTHK